MTALYCVERDADRCGRLIMHRRIGLSASIVSIGRTLGRVVEKFEVGLLKINYDAVETSSINIKSVENERRDRRSTVLVSSLTEH